MLNYSEEANELLETQRLFSGYILVIVILPL